MNKKMIKLGLGATALAASMALVACGDDSSSGSSSKPSEKEGSYETFDDLPTCNNKHADEQAFVEEDNINVICNADEGDWATVVASKKKMGDCSRKTQDELVYVDASEEYYKCQDSEWKLLGEEDDDEDFKSSESKDDEKSSSSKTDDEGDDDSSSSKADDEGDDDSSSSKADDEGNDDDKSSDSKVEEEVKKEVVVKIDTIAGTVIKTDTLVQHQTIIIQDTAYVTIEVPKKDENGDVVKDEEGNTVVEMELIPTAPTKPLVGEPACKNAMFCGKEGDIQVETTVGKSNYGWWYTYTDDGDGGTTKITWPFGFDENDSFVWPSVLETAGLKAKVTFGKGYEYPYAGLGFDLVDAKDSYADITDWDGMCVIYNTAQPLYLQVKPTAEKATTGYNNPMAVLPSTDSKNAIIDIDWSLFQQEPGWGKEVTTASVLKKASKITFKLSGEAGTSNTFIIYAIGKKGSCEGGSVVPTTPVEEDPVDVFGGKGDFWEGTGDISYFKTFTENHDTEKDYGAIEVTESDAGNEVLQFYTNYGVEDDYKYYVQLTKEFTLEKGYSYQVQVSGYDWTDDEDDYEILHIGIQNPSTYDNYIDNDGSVWTTNHNFWESGVYNHCSTNKTAKFYINGASDKDDTGIHIQSIKLIKTPISCK